MKRLLAGTTLFLAALSAAAAESLSRRIADYEIRARLDPGTKTIQGRQRLTWLNDTETPAEELRFHLYLNAFRDERSTFMKESGGSSRGFRADARARGGIDLTRIQIRDGADLTPSVEFVRPDDGNPDDRTVCRVALPAPVRPGERIELEIDFTAKLPRVFARSGYSGDFFMVGQWFPKIGVFEKGAWNCHQYHAESEFYADFGAYRVEITVPARFVVGATGRRVADRKNPDGTRTVVHVQEDVHDFAWTACPDFVERRERFVLADPAVDTEMIVLVHRAHLGHQGRYIRALRQGLEFYSRRYGAYPYPTITLVDPAPGAAGAGGMEYPTLFTAGTMSWLPAGIRLPEMVTIHEFGHGYWYGMVASNEFEEAWLDEGVNTYSEIKAMSEYYGADRSMLDWLGLRIGSLDYHRMIVVGTGRFDPILKNSWEFVSGGSYGANVYSKAGLMLLTLERLLGEKLMGRIMRTYFERWKFRHPRSEDFVAVAEEVSGRPLGWFFEPLLRRPDKMDYAVTSVGSEAVAAGREKPSGESGPGPLFRNEAVVARLGELAFPQTVLLVFENGEKLRRTWDGRDRWTRFVITGPARLDFAEVDPDGIWLLDVNRANNSLSRGPRPSGLRKLALALTSWFQHVFVAATL